MMPMWMTALTGEAPEDVLRFLLPQIDLKDFHVLRRAEERPPVDAHDPLACV